MSHAATMPGRTRGLRFRWADAPHPEPTQASLVDRVLASRGLLDQRDVLLSPSLHHLHDPSLLPDADRACERVLRAARAREPIVIYSDYDADGVTAGAILVRAIRALEPEALVSTYTPHRLDEGYGINAEAIASLADAGARVVVSVDCGITAIEPARVARDRGLDLIVTDHHAFGASLPEAHAIVHPRLPGSGYPFGDLSGSGVAFKLAWRLGTVHAGSERVPPAYRELLLDLLALATLGLIADVVPLRGENRAMARVGLARMTSTGLVGLRALIRASGLAGDSIDAEHVGFRLAPRLNACGRLEHAREALELLVTSDAIRAEAIARELTQLNNERRAVEERILEAAMVEARPFVEAGDPAIVLAHEDWHAGVVGIVCSRLVERLARPVLLMQRGEGVCHGSGRSVEGFDLHAALAACAPTLLTFGGHAMAAGLRVEAGRLEEFRAAFRAEAGSRLAGREFAHTLRADARAMLREFTVDAIAALDSLAPFGAGHPRPVLRVDALTLDAAPEPLGSSGRHAALRLRDGATAIRAVAWGWMDDLASLRRGVRVDSLLTPKVSEWQGRRRVEAEIRDLRLLA